MIEGSMSLRAKFLKSKPASISMLLFWFVSTILLACNRQEFIGVPEPLAGSGPASEDQTPDVLPEETDIPAGQAPEEQTESPSTMDNDPIMPVPTPTEPETPKPTDPIPETPDPTEPTEPEPAPVKKYRIIGYESNRCITAPENTGVPFEIRDCGSAAAQQFTLESVAKNTMKIVTFKNHVMEIRGNTLVDGAVVQTANYSNKATQKWRVESKNYSGFEALNVFDSVFTLDALEKGTANGTKIQIWRTDTPTPNQRWMIQEI